MNAPPPRHTTSTGARAEAVAAAYLTRHGLQIIARNAIAGGVEIDLIARKHGAADDGGDALPTFVFIEVRSRRDDTRGHPLETVGAHKRRRQVKGATAWLVAQGLWERVHVRFDVVSVVGALEEISPRAGAAQPSRSPSIQWLANAFEAHT